VPRPRAAAWTVAGWGLGVALGGTAAVRALRPERSTTDIAVTALAPWLLAPSWVLLVGALVMRRRGLAALAASLAAYHVACARARSGPLVGLSPYEDGPQLGVAFANVWKNNPDVGRVLGELARGEHDIVALAEVTDDHVAIIDELFPVASYPWRWCAPEALPGSRGLALLSRVPLDEVDEWSSQDHPQLEVAVRIDGALPVRLLVVHTWGPVGGPAIRRWRAQLAEIAARASSTSARSSALSGADGRRTVVGQPMNVAVPTVVIGDFNATRQHRSFDRLVGASWSDARTTPLGGWRATWPANRWWHPPVLAIDHILAGPGISVRSSRAGRARGSDHRPLSAVLLLPMVAS
jgi:endonuclease/exonuclease/phosphatase (EEP) superfamily protein YafD